MTVTGSPCGRPGARGTRCTASADLDFAADERTFRLRRHARVPLARILDEAGPLIDLRAMIFEPIAAPDVGMRWRLPVLRGRPVRTPVR